MQRDGRHSRHCPVSSSHTRVLTSAARFLSEGSGVLLFATASIAAGSGAFLAIPNSSHTKGAWSVTCSLPGVTQAIAPLVAHPKGYACRKVYMKQLWAALCPKLDDFRHSDARAGPELAQETRQAHSLAFRSGVSDVLADCFPPPTSRHWSTTAQTAGLCPGPSALL